MYNVLTPAFPLVASAPPPPEEEILRGYIDGWTMINQGPNLDILPGVVKSSDNTETIDLASSITAKTPTAWSVGSSGGLLDGTEAVAGTPDADETFHAYAIKRTDTQVVDFCLSRNGPTVGPVLDGSVIPAAYDKWANIGVQLTTGANALVPLVQSGDRFYLSVPQRFFVNSNPSTGANLATLNSQSNGQPLAPTGVKTIAICTFHFFENWDAGAGTDVELLATSPDQAVTSPGPSSFTFRIRANGSSNNRAATNTDVQILTNTSAQIRWQVDQNPGGLDVQAVCHGFIHPRGKNQ